MTIERKPAAAMPMSRSWQHMIPHIHLGRGVRARHIQVDMEHARTLDLYARAGNVLEAMRSDRYDIVPVTSKGRVVGYVSSGQLVRMDADQNAAISALRKKYPSVATT